MRRRRRASARCSATFRRSARAASSSMRHIAVTPEPALQLRRRLQRRDLHRLVHGHVPALVPDVGDRLRQHRPADRRRAEVDRHLGFDYELALGGDFMGRAVREPHLPLRAQPRAAAVAVRRAGRLHAHRLGVGVHARHARRSRTRSTSSPRTCSTPSTRPASTTSATTRRSATTASARAATSASICASCSERAQAIMKAIVES